MPAQKVRRCSQCKSDPVPGVPQFLVTGRTTICFPCVYVWFDTTRKAIDSKNANNPLNVVTSNSIKCYSCGEPAITNAEFNYINGTDFRDVGAPPESARFRCFACRDAQKGDRSRLQRDLNDFFEAHGYKVRLGRIDEHTPGIIDFNLTATKKTLGKISLPPFPGHTRTPDSPGPADA